MNGRIVIVANRYMIAGENINTFERAELVFMAPCKKNFVVPLRSGIWSGD